ncbi:MAG: DUF6516 family protein [Sphingorhabdus sp.]
MKPDPSLDALLFFDGEIFVIDPAGGHWIKFEVKQTPVTPQRPHGLRYSLTLHGGNGERLVGFDNAHAVTSGSGPGAKMPVAYDHKHRLRSIKPHEYKDAASLLADFWKEVEAVLAERGVIL